jgi:hypothetical protein
MHVINALYFKLKIRTCYNPRYRPTSPEWWDANDAGRSEEVLSDPVILRRCSVDGITSAVTQTAGSSTHSPNGTGTSGGLGHYPVPVKRELDDDLVTPQ